MRLYSMGFDDVLMVWNGQEALDAYDKSLGDDGRYDVIILDISMPVMDGIECVRHLKDRLKNRDNPPKLIALTGGVPLSPILTSVANAMKGDIDECLAAGFDEVLTKPVATDRLLETLRPAAI